MVSDHRWYGRGDGFRRSGAKMARKGEGKGNEAKMSYNGNLLVENRNGLIVNTEVLLSID